jgi:hypothetical protein
VNRHYATAYNNVARDQIVRQAEPLQRDTATGAMPHSVIDLSSSMTSQRIGPDFSGSKRSLMI